MNNVKNNNLSNEGVKKLMDSTHDAIMRFSDHLNTSVKQKAQIDFIKTKYSDLQNNPKEIIEIEANIEFTNKIDGLIDVSMLLGFIYLDLAAATRAYLNAELEYEKRYAIKQLNVIMIEGYKRILGYNSNINKSLLINKVKPIVDKDCPGLINEYNQIHNFLLEIGANGTFDKESRDLSVHYDVEPIKVYNSLLKISAEDSFQHVLPFFSVMQRIYEFITKLIKEAYDDFNRQYDSPVKKIQKHIDKISSYRDKINNDEKAKFDEMISKIEEIKKLFL